MLIGAPAALPAGDPDQAAVTVAVPQKKELPATVKPVTKHAVVRAGVNLKPAKLFRDLTDAAAAAGAGAAGPVVFTGELLTRVGFLGKGLGFDVTDWGEHWKIDVTDVVVGQDGTGTVTYNWQGTVEVNGSGTITGTGTGNISGTAGCVIPVRAFTTVAGVFGVTFGGTKDGDRFNLSVHGTDPSIQVGSFGACDILRDQVVNILTAISTDPAHYFGDFTVFSFDAAAGGRFSGAVGEGTATLTIRATPQS